jgi:hypothetical protein
MNRREKALGHNRGLNAMGAEVLNSTFVLLFGISAKLNICASNPPLRQAPKRYRAFWGDSANHKLTSKNRHIFITFDKTYFKNEITTSNSISRQ